MTRLLPITFLLFLLAACAPAGPGTRSEPVDDPRQAEIERLQEEGRFETAARRWEELAQSRPERRDALLIRAVEAWLSAGEFERAERLLERIDPRGLGRNERVRLDLVQAERAMRRGDLANAGWLLASTAERLPPELVERHAELEAQLRELESSPLRGALDELRQLVGQADFDGDRALALLLEYPLAELENALFEVGNRSPMLPWLDLVISAREQLLDDEALAQALAAWQSRWPDIDYSPESARRWIAAWRQTRPLPDRITVLLPGRDSPLHRPGQALRDGLLAGWLQLAPDRRPTLDFRYIAASDESLSAAWFDIRERGTDLLIGPLERSHADALAGLPDAGLIPTLLLNLPEDPARLSQGAGEIVALALPPETEAELAAIHALATGHERALVLSQYTGWGERVAAAFADTFALGGGQVLEQRIYDPERPDHSTLLKETLGVDGSQARIEALRGLLGSGPDLESVAQPRSDVDVIFLASRPQDGRLLRPQLRFFDVGDVTTMATSHIVDGAPQPERDRDLDGITTPMPPWFIEATPEGVVRQRATNLYQGLDNATLSRLHALGRDAMALVPWLGTLRSDPRLELPGMMGRLSLPDGHVIQRDLPIVELRGGHARPVRGNERETAGR